MSAGSILKPPVTHVQANGLDSILLGPNLSRPSNLFRPSKTTLAIVQSVEFGARYLLLFDVLPW
jgi:hypothetical protein